MCSLQWMMFQEFHIPLLAIQKAQVWLWAATCASVQKIKKL